MREVIRSEVLPFIFFCFGTITVIWAWILVRSTKELPKFLRLYFWFVLWFLPLIFINSTCLSICLHSPCTPSFYLRCLSPGNYISHLPLPPELFVLGFANEMRAHKNGKAHERPRASFSTRNVGWHLGSNTQSCSPCGHLELWAAEIADSSSSAVVAKLSSDPWHCSVVHATIL